MPSGRDLIHETTNDTGTGPYTLAAVNGKVRFSDTGHGFGSDTGGLNTFDVYMSNRSAAQWQRGKGHMSDANTLVIDTVFESSAVDNAAVSFSAGPIDVSHDIPADQQRGAGEIFLWSDTGEPIRGLRCDGMLYDTGGETKDLYGVIRTKYGSGVNQFAVPDYESRNVFFRAADGTTYAVGDTGGDGAPNIIGSVASDALLGSPSGAFTISGSGGSNSSSAGIANVLTFSAANSNAKYGAASEIRPQFSAVAVYIRY